MTKIFTLEDLEGMSISMDISTGEHNAYDRIYGRVIGVMLKDCGAAEDTLIAEEESRNTPLDADITPAADNICELLATLIHFIPTNEPELIKDTMAMCHDIRNGIAAAKEPTP